MGRSLASEAHPYYFTYIDQVPGDDPLVVLEAQLEEALQLFAGISEEVSLRRYAAGKWSIRETLNHVTDTERAFVFRALWFARGFPAPLPGYDQHIAVVGAGADAVCWKAHVEEFRWVRLATVAFFRNLPSEAWSRSGIGEGNPFTVRALAFITAGHLAHHSTVLRERYLTADSIQL